MPSRRNRNSQNQDRGETEAQQGSIATGSSAKAPLCWPASGKPFGSCAARHFQIEVGEDHVPSVVQVPEILECPIACDVMNDPVVTCDGQVFERQEIETWFKDSARSPTTGLALPCKDLVPLPSLQQALETFLRAGPEFKGQHALQISVETTLREELQKTQDHLMSSQCHASELSRMLVEKDDEIANLRQRLRIAENVISALRCNSAPMSTNFMLEVRHSATSSMELPADSLPNLTMQSLQSEVAMQGIWKGVLPQLNSAQHSFISRYATQPEQRFECVRCMAAVGNLQALVNFLDAWDQHGTRIEKLACVGKALSAAAYSGHASVVQYLLELRAHVEAPAAEDHASSQASTDSESSQPSARIGSPESVLARAAWSGHLSVVHLLLASGAPQEQISSAIQAARAGKHHLIRQCLELRSGLHQQDVPELIDYPCQNFIQASQAGNLQGVHDHLSQSGQNHDLTEAVCAAALHGQIGVIRLLLESRACLRFPVTKSPLRAAAFGGNVEVVNHLLAASHPLDPEALIDASFQGFIDVVHLLLSRRCSVNSTSKRELFQMKGLSALMASAMFGNMDVTRALLQHKASPTTTSADGQTALSLALGNGFIENAKLVAKCMPSKYWAACYVYIPDGLDFPHKRDAKRVLAARLPALRFPVGAQVCCGLSCQGRQRQMGTVVRNWFQDAGWPQNHIAHYQIRLDSGNLIWAPVDEDCVIHSVAEFCCQSDTPGLPSTYYIRVESPCPEQNT